ncbi:MAG: LPS assembly protein LptD [Pseudomonadota bacterium]
MVCIPSKKGLLFLYGLVFFIVSATGTGLAAAEGLPKNPAQISWHISAQSVTFDNKRDLYIAEDNVIISGGKTRLEADYVEFSNKTQDAFAQGNVLLISGEDSITCNAMKINLATEIGTISKGNIFIQKSNFHISGENIKKTGKFSYSADKGAITSCSGDNPDWKITGKKINVSIEGYGTASHTILWAKKMPMLYSPYLIFPVKTKRQTGFLLPRITSSDRKGYEYEQPFFWAISRNTDATIYSDYMSDRGTKLGIEYRYLINSKTKGSIFFDALENDKTDDGTKDTELYSFTSTARRTNNDRFWFRMKNNQELPNDFNAKVDIDVVSDEDYLHEFKDGFTGYTLTKEYFDQEFGRSLDEYDDYTRKNAFTISKYWSRYSFRMDTLWYDNVRARDLNTDDPTLQTLPSFQFDASKQKIGPSKFYYSLDSEYTSFYRKDPTATLVNGQRADFYPKLYLPLKLGPYFNFEPSAGARETIYRTSNFTDINGNSDDFRTREIYDIGASLSSKVIKIFDFNNSIADRAKHEIIPELTYVYTPHISQDELPSFDGIDRIAEQHLLTWSVTNNFITRKTLTDPHGKESTNYRDMAYIKLSQSFDIKKERDQESRPFTDITLDAELNPSEFFTLDTDLTWSPYTTHFKSLNIGNTIRDNRGDSLRTEYRYTSSLSESLYAKIDISITDELSAYYSIEQNLLDKKTIQTRAGFSYKKACWQFDLFFEESRGDNVITFLINLKGIGEFGTK